MKKLGKVLGICSVVAVILFILSLVVYFFNLDMKLAAKAQPILEPLYDKRKREHKV